VIERSTAFLIVRIGDARRQHPRTLVNRGAEADLRSKRRITSPATVALGRSQAGVFGSACSDFMSDRDCGRFDESFRRCSYPPYRCRGRNDSPDFTSSSVAIQGSLIESLIGTALLLSLRIALDASASASRWADDRCRGTAPPASGARILGLLGDVEAAPRR